MIRHITSATTQPLPLTKAQRVLRSFEIQTAIPESLFDDGFSKRNLYTDAQAVECFDDIALNVTNSGRSLPRLRRCT